MSRGQIWTGLITILASSWFIPVGCTVMVFPSMEAVSHLDARKMERGDIPHVLMPILVKTESKEKPEVVWYANLRRYVGKSEYSFLLPPGDGELGDYLPHENFLYVKYRVIPKEHGVQLVKVEYTEDDYDFISQYEARNDAIFPLYSREVLTRRILFHALPYALGIALVLNVVARILRKRIS
ncbi:MAG: hypothetical protein ABW117_17745 [Candidatus Sedimenticola sp. 1PA]